MHQPSPASAPPAANGTPHLNGDTAVRNGDLQPPGSAMSQTDQEIVRLIGQHLLSVGLDRSATLLMEESGLHLEHPAAATFRQHVLAGDWGKADYDLRALHELLQDSPHVEPHSLAEMKFVVLEQKYLEHLEAGRALDALHVLRNELTPLGHDTARVHRLSALMMCGDARQLRARARWPGAGPASRAALLQRVQAVLPPALMMAPGRLRALLAQAAAQQAARCRFHAAPRPPLAAPAPALAPATAADPAAPADPALTAPSAEPIPFTLLADHQCSADSFPIHSLQIAECSGPERALRRGVVLQMVAGRLQTGLGLQGQHRHDLGLRPAGQAARLQEISGGPLVWRVVPGVEPGRAIPHRGRPRGLPRPVDMEHGDGAAAPEDDALAGGLADGGGVARRLRQVRVRRRARPVLPLQPRRVAGEQLGRRARERAGVPRGRARRAGGRHAPPRALLRLHRPRRPQPAAGGARGDGDVRERGRLAAAAERGQPGRAPVGHPRARAGAALPRAEPGALHHPRVLRRRAPGLRRLGQRGQQGVHLAHQRRGADRRDLRPHALRQRGLVEPGAPRRGGVRLRRLLAAAVGPAQPPVLVARCTTTPAAAPSRCVYH